MRYYPFPVGPLTLGPPEPPSSDAGGGDGATVDVGVTLVEAVGGAGETAAVDGPNVPPYKATINVINTITIGAAFRKLCGWAMGTIVPI